MGLKGHVDGASTTGVSGWAHDPDQPETRVSLIVTIDDVYAGRILANVHRRDLEAKGIGDGKYGYNLLFDQPLLLMEPRVIRVRRESDGADVRGSPKTLHPPEAFDATARAMLTNALGRYGSDEAIGAKIDFLVAETEKLLSQMADRDSSRMLRRRNADYLRRWGRRLAPGTAEDAPPQPFLRALVIDDVSPQSRRDAGSNAILGHIASLRRIGFEVAFAATQDFQSIASVKVDRGELDALGVFSFHPPFYSSVEDAMLRQRGEFDLIYLHRISNAGKYCELARCYFPKARIVYSVADLHHVRYQRQAKAEDRPELEPYARMIRQREMLAMASVDAVITHSTFEARLIRDMVRNVKVHVATWPLPPRPVATPFSQRRGVAFIGSFGHQPNADAARWLISEIMPLVRQSDPTLECLLVGSDMPDEIVRLCGDGCVAVGAVDDLASIFERVRLTVAPLAYGAGVKGKVLESLAAGLPCVCTPIAAEGIELPEPLHGCVSDNATGLASAILRLHADESANTAAGMAGVTHISRYFSEANVDQVLRQAADIPPYRY